jgi:hypothetical protein
MHTHSHMLNKKLQHQDTPAARLKTGLLALSAKHTLQRTLAYAHAHAVHAHTRMPAQHNVQHRRSPANRFNIVVFNLALWQRLQNTHCNTHSVSHLHATKYNSPCRRNFWRCDTHCHRHCTAHISTHKHTHTHTHTHAYKQIISGRNGNTQMGAVAVSAERMCIWYITL